MQLSASTFGEVLSSVRADRWGYRESRRTPRIPLSATAVIQFPSDGLPPFRVYVRDICANGMGLMSGRPLEPGERFIMELPERNGSMRTLVCETMRCERVADDVYHVGATFVDDGSGTESGAAN